MAFHIDIFNKVEVDFFLFQEFTKVIREILSLQVMSQLTVSFIQESSQSKVLLRYPVYPGSETPVPR